MVGIRRVEPSDARAIAEIYNHYVAHTTVSFETHELSVDEMEERILAIAAQYPYIVACDGDCVLGYCYAHSWKERAAYSLTAETSIYLADSAKGRGIGRLLMDELVGLCRQSGIHSLIACVTAENASSCAFHEHIGFEKVSHFREVGRKFGRYLDVIDYELVLSHE